MITTMRETRAKLSQLANMARQGEEVIITSHGTPYVKLISIPRENGKSLDMDMIRRIAKAASTGRKGGPDATQIISDAREDR